MECQCTNMQHFFLLYKGIFFLPENMQPNQVFMCRCMMHAFNTCMGSLMGHAWVYMVYSQQCAAVVMISCVHDVPQQCS